MNGFDDALDQITKESPAPAAEPATPASDPFASALDAVVSDDTNAREARLKVAGAQAEQLDPNRAADVYRLSRRYGLDPSQVERNFEDINRRAKQQDTPYARMLAETPALAEFVSDPVQAAAVKDDLEPLAMLEKTVTVAGNSLRALAAGVPRFSSGLWGVAESAFETAGLPDLAAQARRNRLDTANMAEFARGAQEGAGPLEQAFYSGFESLGLMIPGSLMAVASGGSAIPALVAIGAGTGGEAYGRARDAGKSVARSNLFALTQGGVEVATEMIPAHLFFKDLAENAPFRKLVMHQLASELPGEEIATALQDLDEWATFNQGKPFSDYLAERPAAAVQTAVSVIASVGAMTAVAHTLNRFAGEQGRVERADQSKAFFDALAQGVTSMKSAEKFPESVQAVIAQATKDGPIEKLYAPIDTFTQYWQSVNEDPEQKAAELTGDPNAYQRALQSGEDLAIPTATYAARVAGTEHNAFFANELRLGPDEMNAREATAFKEEQKANAQAAADAATAAESPTAAIRVALAQQLEAAGIDRSTADSYINLYESTFSSLGERAGVDPVALFQSLGLKVERPDLAAAARQAAPAAAPAVAGQSENAPAVEAAQAAAPATGADAIAVPREPNIIAPIVNETGIVDETGRALGGTSPTGTERRVTAGPAPGGVERRASVNAPGGLQPGFSKSDVVAAAARYRAENPNIDAEAQAMRDRASAAGRIKEPAELRARRKGGVLDKNLAEAQTVQEQDDASTEREASRIVDQSGSPAGNRVEASNPGNDKTGKRADKHLARVFGSVLESARQLDPNVDEAKLREEFDFRVAFYLDQQQLAADAGTDPHLILRTIAKLGGLYEEDNGMGLAGELKRLGAGGKFGSLAGVPGVFAAKKVARTQNQKTRGHGVDVMLQMLQADPRFSWIESTDMLLDQIDEASRHGANKIDAGVLPGTEELRDVGIRREKRWWPDAWAPGDMLGDVNDSPIEEGDTSFDVREFDQSLFDEFDSLEPDQGADTLTTGEVQPRLPEAGAVREQEIATPEVAEVPFSLTSEIAKAAPTKRVERSLSAEYQAAKQAADAASAALREATTRYRAREIGDEEFLAAKKADADAQAAFDRAFEVEQRRGGGRTLFQSEGLTAQGVADFAARTKASAGQDVKAFDVVLTRNGDLELQSLIVARGAQRAGLGSDLMRELTRFADANGARIILTTASRDPVHGTTSRARLIRFYKKFGFVENKGRHKDFRISANMLREPTLPSKIEPVKQTATPAFKVWFGDSKVTDEDGAPRRVYHGSIRADRVGEEFKKSRATSGPMAFFTDDPEIGGKYATGKQDTSLEAPASYAEWFKVKIGRTNTDISRAWYSLTEAQRATIAERISHVTNQTEDGESTEAFRLGGADEYGLAGKDHWDHVLREHRGNWLAAAVDVWLDSGGLFDEEEKFMQVLQLAGMPMDTVTFDHPHAERSAVFPVYLSIQNPLNTSAMPEDVIAALDAASKRQRRKPQSYGADLWDKRLRDPIQWVEELKKDAAEGKNSFVWSSIPDWVTKTLKGLGYDGIQDTGGKMGGDEHTVWVPFEPTQIKSAIGNVGTFDPGRPSILHQGDETFGADKSRRGAIRFGADKQITIGLLERADLSTFLHESGHLFLEVFRDLATQIDATPIEQRTEMQAAALADFNTLKDWLADPDHTGPGFSDKQHEQFARGFEAYLMEGRAPSAQLRAAFARFRAWLVGVYRSLKGLKVDLNDDVRRVLDRMVASDQAIANAEAEARIVPMFTTAEDAGMTPEEFALYRGEIAKASNAAREQLEVKMLAEVQREQQAQWKAQRQELHDEIAVETHAMPVYIALAAIQKGTKPNGGPLTEGVVTPPMKLSRQAIVDRYGADRLKRLPRPYVYAREGGIDPDVAANLFGFSSGDDLLKAIEDAEPMGRRIERETDRRMLERHGSLLLDGTLQEKAQAAMANDHREAIVREELKALARKRRKVSPFVRAAVKDAKAAAQGEIDALQSEVSAMKAATRGGAARINAALPSADTIREAAKIVVADMKVREIKPAVYWAASRRAARLAIDNAARQNFDAAIQAKQQELMSLAVFREATRVKEDIEARVKRAIDLGRPASRARLGKAGESYLEQVDTLLDRYDFSRQTGKAVDRRDAMRRWVSAMKAQGFPITIPDDVVEDARRIHYSELTTQELVGVTDALDQIVHLAQLKNRFLTIAEGRAYDAERDSLVESIRANNTEHPMPLETRPEDRKWKFISDAFASHLKIATIARVMDGGADDGPMTRIFIRPLHEAANQEMIRQEQVARAFTKLYEDHYTPQEIGAFGDKRFIGAIKGSLSKEARLAVALNWGNEGGRERLLNDPTRHWHESQIHAILDTLDERDWKFVRDYWAAINLLWPDIAALERRTTGLEPEKVNGIPVHTAFGTFEGAYYPINYDAGRGARAKAIDEENGVIGSASHAATNRGHTKARVAHTDLPLRLDLSVGISHVEKVIHDLTHRETVSDLARLLRDRKVAGAFYDTRGQAFHDQFQETLTDIARGVRPARGLDLAFRWVRNRTTVAMLGLNLWTSLQQPLGMLNGAQRVGAKWVAKGLFRWVRDAATMQHTVEWIWSVSPMMKERGAGNVTQDLSDLRASLRAADGWFDRMVRSASNNKVSTEAIANAFTWHIGRMQRIADVPTWLGAYEKAHANGADEKTAIFQADQAVIDSQGGNSVKDLASVQRGGEAAKMFMLFYSYGNTVLNSAYAAGATRSFKSPAQVAAVLSDLSLLYVLPAMGTVALAYGLGKGGAGDDKKYDLTDAAIDVARESVSSMLNGLVVVRELAGLTRENGSARGYAGPAGTRLLQLIYTAAQQAGQGELDDKAIKAIEDVAGVVFALPIQQVQKTIDGIAALSEGKTSNPGAILVGPPPKKKKRR